MSPIPQHFKSAPVKPTKASWSKLPQLIVSISIATGNRVPKYSSVICILRIHIDCLFQLAPALKHPVKDYIRKDMTRNDSDESALDVTIAAKPYISYVHNEYPSHDSLLGMKLVLRSFKNFLVVDFLYIGVRVQPSNYQSHRFRPSANMQNRLPRSQLLLSLCQHILLHRPRLPSPFPGLPLAVKSRTYQKHQV